MSKNCSACNTSVAVSESEKDLCKKIDVPLPSLCVDCSHQRRFAFRNERSYYKRNCDLTGKPIISIFAPDSPHKVYHRESWFSDAFNTVSYGRDIDFSRPFFEQLHELSLDVPWEHMVIVNCENCDYCNYILDSRNCYLSVRVDAEDAYYCYLAIKSKDCFDSYNIVECERCYECVDCTQTKDTKTD